MCYTKRNIGLSSAQVSRLSSAIEHNQPLSFTKYNPTGNVPVYLTKGQVAGLSSGKALRFSKRQLQYMLMQGGFLGTLLRFIGPALKAVAPVAKAVGPAIATGALSGAASYGANKLLQNATGDGKRGRGFQLKPYGGNGYQLKPYRGGSVSVELTPNEVNGLLTKKKGGFLSLLASLAAGLLPTLLGNGLSKSEIGIAKDVIGTVAQEKSTKKAQQRLDRIAQKYGSGLLGKLFGLPGNKVPVLGDIPLLNVLF